MKNPPTIVTTLASIILFFILLFAFAKFGPSIPFSVNQTNTTQQDVFTVSGEGKISVKPDIAQVNFGVSQTAATVAQVQSQTNAAINKVTQSLKNLGVANEDIKTTSYNIYPQYNSVSQNLAVPENSVRAEIMMAPIPPETPTQTKVQKIVAYNMSVAITVKVRDLNKVNSVIDAATSSGANEMNGIGFTLDKPEKYQSDARKMAIEDAKKKAGELSSQTGINLGKIINIYDNSNPYSPQPYLSSLKVADSAVGGGQTQVSPGSTEIVSSVTLSYQTR